MTFAFLRAKSRQVEALRAAWNDAQLDFDIAAVPGQEARQRGRKRTFRDPGTELAVLEGRREVALALKSRPGWTSVYTLNPVLPAAFLRALARHAGAHLYHDRDDTLYASRSFLTLAADAAGRRQIQLPRHCDVFDPFTGERLWRGVKTFERDFQARETVILRLA